MSMKIAVINICDYGSTGKIMAQTAEIARDAGHTVKTFSRKWINSKNESNDHTFFGSFFENALHHIVGEMTGASEHFSLFGTYALIRKLQRFKPDVIHLHNLHGWYINIPLLFWYIKRNNIRVVWTLHDCWSFTGHCPHFDMIGCEKWKTGCHQCPQYKEYPRSFVDNARYMYKKKKKWFTGVEKLTIVTPSKWLASLVRQSILKDYPVIVIPNGIDLNVFTPLHDTLREQYVCLNKFIVLGVAFGWNEKKGLDVFIELAETLDNEKYQIVLVGTDDAIEKKLPDSVISIRRTQKQKDLAQLYSTANVFVNPTREDTFPTVNMEALACGTPVVTFATGGSGEMLDSSCGVVVPKDDVSAMREQIIHVCEGKKYMQQFCVDKAKSFDKNEKFRQYVKLYEEGMDYE